MIWARAHWRRHILRYLYIKFTQNLILQSLYRFIHHLAHMAHQTPLDPIYQMCHISYLLQHATIESQICHGTEPVWHMDLFFFIPLSLSYLFHLLLQLFTTSISTLSHISFFFSFSYSPPPSPLSHTLSSSLSPFVLSILSVLSLTLPIRYYLFLRVANSRISESSISSLGSYVTVFHLLGILALYPCDWFQFSVF